LYLTELAPSLRNNLGILNQLAMVLGLIVAQSLALAFTRGYAWRYILVIATALAATLLAMSVFVREGGKAADLDKAPTADEADEQTALLASRRGGSEEDDEPAVPEDMTVKDVFRTRDKEVRRGCEFSTQELSARDGGAASLGR
jgi:MFS family permease